MQFESWSFGSNGVCFLCFQQVHVLPREVFGKSTFELAIVMMKWLPLWLVDKLLLVLAWLVLGNIEKYGLKRPSMGPLELKNEIGKTPVLDIGALEKIKSGDIKVVPGIKRFTRNQVELVNGEKLDVDSVVLATGYRSNVPSWPLFSNIANQTFVIEMNRKVNSSRKTDSQKQHHHMRGREMQGFMQLGSQEEGYQGLHQTP